MFDAAYDMGTPFAEKGTRTRNGFAIGAKMNSFGSIENLAVFVDTVRSGSFSAVARRNGVAASSIARQIDLLEKDLGVVLFARSTRSLRPTDAGQRLFERARTILEDMADARREVTAFHEDVQGVLRITCLPTFGRRYLVPAFDLLARTHPRLSLDLDLTERLADPAFEKLDAAIRFGDLADSNRIAQKVATQRYVMCASLGYLAINGTPKTAKELAGHRLIDKRHRANSLGWREVLGNVKTTDAMYVLESDDYEAQRDFLIRGGGIARLPDWVVGPDVAAGSVIELSLDDVPKAKVTGIHIVRAIPRPSARLRAFSVALEQVIRKGTVWHC